MPTHEHKSDIRLPAWLRTAGNDSMPFVRRSSLYKERFLDKTIRHIVSFIENSIFNETTSRKDGLLQRIEPRLKIITLLILIFVLSLQRSLKDVLIFVLASIITAILSRIDIKAYISRLMPAAVFTALIALPATLNLIVDGNPLLVLYRFSKPVHLLGFVFPEEIAITEQGAASAITLCIRVIASVSFVFLMTMTTNPNKFMKALTSLVPGLFRPLISISYRYIFFLVKKVELFIMAFKSRSISPANASKSRRWAASRMGILFAVSMDVGRDIEMAMESRGCSHGELKIQKSKFRLRKLSKPDILWFLSAMFFAGAMLWKSMN